MQKKEKKYLDYNAALQKLQNFCAYQERSHEEVKSKLIELGVYGDTLDNVIVALIEENYLNEERFAKIFASGKFNIKKWGKVRIKQELKLRKISDYCIKKAMAEIHDDDYQKTIDEVITKKAQLLGEKDSFILRQKLFNYTLQKGYEIDLINQGLNRFFEK